MTNWEKDKEKYLKMAACGRSFAVEEGTGNIFICERFSCDDCIFRDVDGTCSNSCSEARAKWLDEEYVEPKKPEIDWNKVPVDTPVLVWDDDDEDMTRRHFAKYRHGKVHTFAYGATSWSTKSEYRTAEWDHAKIADGVDCSKWYKE